MGHRLVEFAGHQCLGHGFLSSLPKEKCHLLPFHQHSPHHQLMKGILEAADFWVIHINIDLFLLLLLFLLPFGGRLIILGRKGEKNVPINFLQLTWQWHHTQNKYLKDVLIVKYLVCFCCLLQWMLTAIKLWRTCNRACSRPVYTQLTILFREPFLAYLITSHPSWISTVEPYCTEDIILYCIGNRSLPHV